MGGLQCLFNISPQLHDSLGWGEVCKAVSETAPETREEQRGGLWQGCSFCPFQLLSFSKGLEMRLNIEWISCSQTYFLERGQRNTLCCFSPDWCSNQHLECVLSYSAALFPLPAFYFLHDPVHLLRLFSLILIFLKNSVQKKQNRHNFQQGPKSGWDPPLQLYIP